MDMYTDASNYSTNKETTIYSSSFEFCRVRVVHAPFPIYEPLMLFHVIM